MKILILIIISMMASTIFASCESKLISGVQRKLKDTGRIVSVDKIKISNQEKITIEQGAYFNEKTRYDIEILDETLSSFSGLTRDNGDGCIVEYLQLNPTTL